MENEALVDWTEYLEGTEQSVLSADGFDQAFLGVVFEWGPPRAVYSYEKCVNVLIERDKMTQEEALEYMEYNVVGAYVGEQTPIFVRGTP
jgi:hypothetical protein|tara:strand:+ start:4475 stop:4744 length:270 start_codon:yes stop_codon:yes gene_type:complete